jgi:hypothetical protein
MEGIDIDSIVRKAVTEYRRQEREHAEVAEAHTLTVAVRNLQLRCDALGREIQSLKLIDRLEGRHGER